MTEHPSAATIERFAIGALEDEDEAFIAHVAACETCAEKLAREARLELALVELAAYRKAGAARSNERRGRMANVVFPAFVLVAAAAVFLLLRRPSTPPITTDVAADPSLSWLAEDDSPPPPDVQPVVDALRPKFRECYTRGLQEDPTLEGRVVLAATVAPSGEVVRAEARQQEGLSTPVVDCLVQVVREVRFAPGKHTSTLHIPIAFVRSK